MTRSFVTSKRRRRQRFMSTWYRRFCLLAFVAAAAACSTARAAGPPATATRVQQLTAPGAVTSLELAVLNGDVKISPGASFSASVELIVRAQDSATAEALLKQADVPLEFERGRAKIDATRPLQEARNQGEGAPVLETKFVIRLPAAAAAKVRTVNAPVKAEGITGELQIEAINGHVEVWGAQNRLRLRSVNGRVLAQLARADRKVEIDADTVNGPIAIWLPNVPAKLDARTLNGEILSTLAFPVREGSSPRFGPPSRRYEGRFGDGDVKAEVEARSVNGKIAVMGLGHKEGDAKAIVTMGTRGNGHHHRSRGRAGGGGGREERGGLGAVMGDLTLETSDDVRAASVEGSAKIKAAGDVRIDSVGKQADIFTSGGDIRLGLVKGALRARSGGGDVRIGDAGADAHVETQGGDVRVTAAAGAITALTQGGDINLRGARGSVRAVTAGGDIVVEVVGQARTGSELSTGGGDITLILPSNTRAELAIEAHGGDASQAVITSEFPEIAVVRRGAEQSAAGKLGGGGPKIVLRSRSGEVLLKKGPPAP
ncbi:MAG TPA: hypothetical protein VGG33_00930 [Polyangia bacterium]